MLLISGTVPMPAHKLPGMRARKPAAATAIFLILLFTAGLGGMPIAVPIVVPIAVPIAVAESVDQSVRPIATSVVPTANNHAAMAFAVQKAQRGDFPLKRRRNRMTFWHHFTSWTHSSSPLTWVVALPLALLGVAAAPAVFFLRRWFRRKGSTAEGEVYSPMSTDISAPTDIAATDERLRRLSDLHASGALTDAEFESEKRRTTGGG
jgi:hypothetical protein